MSSLWCYQTNGGMKLLFFIVSFFITTSVFGQQGFTYSYVDPCSKTVKTIFIQSGQSVTINYLGFLGTFTQSDFQNGVFDNWVSTVSQQAISSPCDELLVATQRGQNQIITQNIISTLTSITASATMSTNSLASSVSNTTTSSSNSGGGRRNRNSTNNQQNNGNGTTNNSQGSTSNSSSTQSGGSNQGGNQSSSSTNGNGGNQEGGTTGQSNNVSQGGGGSSEQSVNFSGQSSSNNGSNSSKGDPNTGNNDPKTPGGQGTTDGTTKQSESGGGQGGTTASVSNVSSATSSKSGGSRVRVGSIIGTGDLVVLRSNEDGSNQFKGTMSVTKSNTNNTFAKGVLLNFTTSINNTNVTLYGARSNAKKTNTIIFANSSMIDFKRNIFNTTTVMDSKRFGKVNMMGGLNFTIGGLAGKPFTNLSAVGGGFVPFTANKKISGNILLLGVYSPFTKFYDGKWWDSGLLIVPFSSWDYTISKSFKYNVSFSGTYEVKGSVLNYQVLTGAKILL
jgi:hypothetical protein